MNLLVARMHQFSQSIRMFTRNEGTGLNTVVFNHGSAPSYPIEKGKQGVVRNPQTLFFLSILEQ